VTENYLVQVQFPAISCDLTQATWTQASEQEPNDLTPVKGGRQ